MPILTDGDYPAVRASLDLTLTPTELPDAVIALPVYQGLAESQVSAALAPLPYSDYSSTDQATLLAATVLLTASLLAPVLPVLTTEQIQDGYRYQRQAVDLVALAAVLRSRADALLAQVVEPTSVTPDRPTFFTLATGQRGRSA